MSKEVKRYAERDAYELDEAGNYYCRHVMAMTSEGLHGKSDIAAELAWRDQQIDALLAERDAMEAQVNALQRGIKAKLPRRSLVPVGSGALHAEQNYCYRRGWKDGVAALRSQIRAALQGAQP